MRPYYGRMESETQDDPRLDDEFYDHLEEDDLPPTYEVKTIGYCGMVLPHDEFETYDEALIRVKQRVTWLEKQGCEVQKLNAYTWEVGEPENCYMVPDFCGTLVIKEVFK